MTSCRWVSCWGKVRWRRSWHRTTLGGARSASAKSWGNEGLSCIGCQNACSCRWSGSTRRERVHWCTGRKFGLPSTFRSRKWSTGGDFGLCRWWTTTAILASVTTPRMRWGRSSGCTSMMRRWSRATLWGWRRICCAIRLSTDLFWQIPKYLSYCLYCIFIFYTCCWRLFPLLLRSPSWSVSSGAGLSSWVLWRSGESHLPPQ